ncbi:hypothetical protein BMS3Abin04_02052 [bacterium BMS3Abin04]|nr:hypothetical protein BMS3Abin04_02052 [bacterium BMS3Abin04]
MIELSHKKLEVWKQSIELVKILYLLTNKIPNDELYGITSQMRRAAVSIPSNISEGFARKSKVETKGFLEIARSSLVELDTQIEICLSLEYLSINNLNELKKLSNSIFAMLTALINRRK